MMQDLFDYDIIPAGTVLVVCRNSDPRLFTTARVNVDADPFEIQDQAYRDGYQVIGIDHS